MQSNSTLAFPYSLSPLCCIPSPQYTNTPNARLVNAIDTLSRAGQALESLYQDASNEEFGRALLLETIHNAMKHAITLIQDGPAPDKGEAE